MAAELTTSSGDDASTVPDLLDQIEVPYDHRSIYERVGAAGTEDVVIVIPPRRARRCRRVRRTARGRNEKRLYRGFER